MQKTLGAPTEGLVRDLRWKTVPHMLRFPVEPLWFGPLSQKWFFEALVFPGAVLLPVPPAIKLPANSPQQAAQKGCLVHNPDKYVTKSLSLTVQ